MALTDANLRLTTDQLATSDDVTTDSLNLQVAGASYGVGTPLWARIAVTTDGASTGSIIFRVIGMEDASETGPVALVRSRSYDGDTELLAGDTAGDSGEGSGTIIMLEIPALPRVKYSGDSVTVDLDHLAVDWTVTGTITGLTVTVDIVTHYEGGRDQDYYDANSFGVIT